MSPLAEFLREVFRAHGRGPDRRLPLSDLHAWCKMVGVAHSPRYIRRAIAEVALVEPIVGDPRKRGYYLAETAEQARGEARILRSYVLSLAGRLRAIERHWPELAQEPLPGLTVAA